MLSPDTTVVRVLQNTIRIARAISTNQVAWLLPSIYVQLTGQTGRGDRTGETPEAVSDYFLRSFWEYFDVLGVARSEAGAYLSDKVLVEYGPGDLPGVALLMLAFGARRVVCVDRFPLVSLSPFAVATVEALLSRLPAQARQRATQVLRSTRLAVDGFDDDRLQYRVTRDGLCRLNSEVDFIFSRAVLEHVNDVSATFADMFAALKPAGVAVHLVDLKSHGLHRANPLDFLAWPDWLWNLMYSAKGVPNRWRIDKYRRELELNSFELQQLRATGRFTPAEVAAARPHLAAEFRGIADEDLACAGFWLVCRKPS